MISRSWELRELFYKVVVERFHDKLSGVMKAPVEMFTPKPLTNPEAEVETKVTLPPPETEVATIFGTKPVVDIEPIPLVLKIVQEMKQEDVAARTHLDKQDDMFNEE